MCLLLVIVLGAYAGAGYLRCWWFSVSNSIDWSFEDDGWPPSVGSPEFTDKTKDKIFFEYPTPGVVPSLAFELFIACFMFLLLGFALTFKRSAPPSEHFFFMASVVLVAVYGLCVWLTNVCLKMVNRNKPSPAVGQSARERAVTEQILKG